MDWLGKFVCVSLFILFILPLESALSGPNRYGNQNGNHQEKQDRKEKTKTGRTEGWKLKNVTLKRAADIMKCMDEADETSSSVWIEFETPSRNYYLPGKTVPIKIDFFQSGRESLRRHHQTSELRVPPQLKLLLRHAWENVRIG